MKQILLNLIEDTKDIEDFTRNGMGYAPIIGRARALEKEPNVTRIVYEDKHLDLPGKVMNTPLAIGKRIWTIEGNTLYPAKIAFLGEHSLITDEEDLDWEDRTLKYKQYGVSWFSSESEALEALAIDYECDVEELIKDYDGTWRAPEKKEGKDE